MGVGYSILHIPWATWTPTLYKNDNSTSLSFTNTLSRYCQIGKVIFFRATWSINDGQTPGLNIYATLPSSARNDSATTLSGTLRYQHGGNGRGWGGNLFMKSDGSRFQLVPTSAESDAARTWSDYTGITLYLSGSYEVV